MSNFYLGLSKFKALFFANFILGPIAFGAFM